MKLLTAIVFNVLLCVTPLAMGTYVITNTSINQPELI